MSHRVHQMGGEVDLDEIDSIGSLRAPYVQNSY